jgi:hypothetical protein
MVGSSEFHVVGTLRDWDVTGRLHEIGVPALLSPAATTRSPRRSSSTRPRAVGAFLERIDGAAQRPEAGNRLTRP